MKNVNDKKLYFGAILILSFTSFLNSASIYYEKPSSARLAAASHTPPACTYQNKKYAHGQQVTTPEPCLNCTCRKGVLLCFLRVCPTLIQSSPHDNCKTIRDPGQCCPTLKCETPTLTTLQASTTTSTESTETTAKLQFFSTKLLESATFENNGKTESTTARSELINISSYDSGTSDEKPESIPTTAKQLQTENVTLHYSQVLSNDDKIPAEKTKFINNKIDNRITVTQKDKTTTIFQTSPSTTFHESVLLVTSSPTSPFEQNNENFINNAEGSCIINGTIYAEGSAVISTSFCEYCYCIRSKRMCIRPRCHLSILGCLPRYTSEYACCPTSYVCGEQALTTLPFTTSTTTTSTEYSLLYGRKTACTIDGIEYRVGDPIPSDQHCKQCYCSTGGIKKCKKIQCSTEMEGCIPVIPEGHCCPVEYKCNSTQTVTETSKIISEILKQTTLSYDNENVTESTDSATTSDEIITEDMKDSVITDPEVYWTQESTDALESNSSVKVNSSESSGEISSYETTTPLNIVSLPPDTNLSNTNHTNNHTNDHQLRREEIIYENDSENSLLTEDQTDFNPRLSEGRTDSLETTTNTIVEETTKDDKSTLKTEFYTEKITNNPNNESVVENKTEIYSTTTESVLTSTDSSSVPSEKPNTTESSIETTLKETSLPDNRTVILSRNESSDDYTNETTFEKVEEFLQGIIHAIDEHLHRKIPAEPRIKDKNSNEVLLSKKINDQEMMKPASSRSEVNAGVSSSIFISDDHNSHPYKSSFNSNSDGVEIITAKTAFYDLNENSGDSILISLTPSSLRVGSAPFSHPNPSNDRNIQTLAQNNRSPIYGKPANSYSHHMLPANDWRIVSSNFPRRPQFEDSFAHPESSDSLYYNNDNIRRHDTEEAYNESNKELDKKPRLEVDGPNDPNRMKVVPFKINDAVGSLSLKRKNGSFIIRLPAPNKNVSPDSTPKSTQQISCFYNSQEYLNGAMIPKSDPCTLCRCFYGRELCQEQKCPSPPEKDCVPEKLAGYCCPRYICRVIEDPNFNQNPNKTAPQGNGFMSSAPETPSTSPIRKGPQFPSAVQTIVNINNSSYENSKNSLTDILPQNMNHFDDKSSKEENEKYYQSIPEFPAVPSHVHGLQSRYPPFPLDPTPNTYNRIPAHNINNKAQTTNRIHFPNTNVNEKEQQTGPQPPLSDSISALIPPRPQSSNPFIAGPSQAQYNGGTSKFRIKPPQTVNQQQPSSLTPISQQRPVVRLPPFLLHSMPNTHLAVNNNMRHKPNNNPMSQNHHSIPSSESHPTKLMTSEASSGISVKASNSSAIDASDRSKIESSTRPTQMTTHLQSNKNINSMFDPISLPSTVKPTSKTTKVQPITQSSTLSSTTPSSTTTTTTTTTTTSTSSTTTSPKTTTSIGENSKEKTKAQNPWDLFKVSGCNIYGTMYKIDEQISQLSSTCKKCTCSSQGVKCSTIC